MAAACVAAAAGTPVLAEDLATTLNEKGLAIRSADGAVAFTLGGRLQADLGSGGSRAVSREFPDGADVRRFWIEPKVRLFDALIFSLQYDPTSATLPIKNLSLSYTGLGPLTVTAGNFKEPFSLEQLISSNDTTFLERSLADTFAPSRNTGLAVGAHGERWTVSAGVFGGNVNSTVDKGGVSGTVRATFAPILDGDQVLHLGAAGSHRSVDRRGPAVSFAATPESFLFRTSLVDTGSIEAARAVSRAGLEAAYAVGPVRLQGEYLLAAVERLGAGDLVLDGGYVNASWVLNGTAARYALSSEIASEIGVFKRVEPSSGQRVSRGGVGVFEIAGRYSALNLGSRDVRGGFQQDVTAGLNWYPEPFVRVMANYVRAWADPTATALTGRPARADIGQVRVQIAF